MFALRVDRGLLTGCTTGVDLHTLDVFLIYPTNRDVARDRVNETNDTRGHGASVVNGLGPSELPSKTTCNVT